jgi:hypothetical protein
MPRCSLLCAAAACYRRVLGEPPALRASRSRRRGRPPRLLAQVQRNTVRSERPERRASFVHGHPPRNAARTWLERRSVHFVRAPKVVLVSQGRWWQSAHAKRRRCNHRMTGRSRRGKSRRHRGRRSCTWEQLVWHWGQTMEVSLRSRGTSSRSGRMTWFITRNAGRPSHASIQGKAVRMGSSFWAWVYPECCEESCACQEAALSPGLSA